LASISAAHEPLGPPPITATLNIRKKNNTVYKTYIFFAYKSAFLKIMVNIEICFPNSANKYWNKTKTLTNLIYRSQKEFT